METALLIGTIVAITSIATFGRVEDPAEIVWVAALSVFAVPYASAFLVALGSTSTFGRPLVFRSKRALAFRASTIDVPAWGSWTIEDGDARVSRTA
ncbi:MAG: hypothetical protein HY652_03835 [Acidobacteria bacterium]|nr:hypothetical protein [Acidobacteriota bacterium]